MRTMDHFWSLHYPPSALPRLPTATMTRAAAFCVMSVRVVASVGTSDIDPCLRLEIRPGIPGCHSAGQLDHLGHSRGLRQGPSSGASFTLRWSHYCTLIIGAPLDRSTHVGLLSLRFGTVGETVGLQPKHMPAGRDVRRAVAEASNAMYTCRLSIKFRLTIELFAGRSTLLV
ncbi:hypothetical protein GY45DRAFT_514314 [Cubamyces sp. BRFM 1775]|nr:hypothetical protein GY45DRAFT_514314 [Cubamyces sp. BRFM 1775]